MGEGGERLSPAEVRVDLEELERQLAAELRRYLRLYLRARKLDTVIALVALRMAKAVAVELRYVQVVRSRQR
jgi:hypothetical protein